MGKQAKPLKRKVNEGEIIKEKSSGIKNTQESEEEEEVGYQSRKCTCSDVVLYHSIFQDLLRDTVQEDDSSDSDAEIEDSDLEVSDLEDSDDEDNESLEEQSEEDNDYVSDDDSEEGRLYHY